MSDVLVKHSRGAREDAERARERATSIRASAETARASSDEHRVESDAAYGRQNGRTVGTKSRTPQTSFSGWAS